MKGQISVEFYFAILVFIIFVVYILYQIANIVPLFVRQIKEDVLTTEAYQISEILVNDAGSPENWNTISLSSVQRVGLSSQAAKKTNVLSLAKIADLDGICDSSASGSGYGFVKSRLGTTYDFSVFAINRATNTPILSCTGPDTDEETGDPLKVGKSVAFKRIVAFDNGDFGEVTVQVWSG